jgi:DNA-binding NarL/FixJ family response regulator
VLSGTFATIDWANGSYVMETAIDVTGGINYSVMGVNQISKNSLLIKAIQKYQLTLREEEIIVMVSEGFRHKEI